MNNTDTLKNHMLFKNVILNWFVKTLYISSSIKSMTPSIVQCFKKEKKSASQELMLS
jgi:hypothetical protein